MCKELDLIKTSLGIYNLKDWPIETSCMQLNKENTSKGIYLIINTKNGKLLIGEGKLGGHGNRPMAHIQGHSSNKLFLKDLQQFGKESFKLWGIVPEKDEIQRKRIENKLQIYFKDNCYNRPRREYPTQKELINDVGSKQYGKILDRLDNYEERQRTDGFNKCWESNYSSDGYGYGKLKYNNKDFKHHILMYILHKGDICGITSTIHHKCENKKCVNPEHLELTTNIGNMQILCGNNKSKIEKLFELGYNKNQIKSLLQISNRIFNSYIKPKFCSKYLGVCVTKYKNFYVRLFNNGQSINIGCFNSEIEAAQNRDYYIVKNNLLQSYILNFHDIDYKNFIPHDKNK